MSQPRRQRRRPRRDLHKYPLSDNGTRSYLLDRAPARVLDRAIAKARRDGSSLRVVLIDFLIAFVQVDG